MGGGTGMTALDFAASLAMLVEATSGQVRSSVM